MDLCPPEVWGEIYSFACTDNGRTGRSLSLVSRSLNAISKPYKFQSVAVVGGTQLLAFAALLERTPPPLRRVKCIYLFYKERPSRPGQTSREREKAKVFRTIDRILTAIAPSVKVLHKFINLTRYPMSGFLHVNLPVLEELVEHYPIPYTPLSAPNTDIQLTALRRLKLTFPCNPEAVFGNYNYLAQTPNVTHVSFRCNYNENAQLSLASYLTSDDIRRVLPSRLERLFIHPNTSPPENLDSRTLEFYKHTMQLLEDFARTDERVVLMPQIPACNQRPNSTVASQTAMSIWTASAEGHDWWEQ